jgi:alanyl-tRNA synthetase
MAIFAPTIYYFQQPVQAAAVAAGITATGGQITQATIDGILYRIHTFTSSADFIVSAGSGNVDYLIVGGGGGGKGDIATAGGKDPSAIDAALELARSAVTKVLST